MEGAASCGDNSTDKDQIHAKVGHLESPDIVRIVHISDTHEKQDTFIPKIPRGDILIHSGDFTNFKIVGSLEEDMEKINDFFRKLPHKHKIFVAGNHDIQLAWRSHCPKKIADLLHNGIYLQDSSVTLEGIKIYGSPWNTSDGMGFYEADLKPVWHKVPNNTDILVTHNPPFGIKDFGYNKFWCDGDREWICDFCTEKNASGDTVYHGSYAHQGCMNLRKAIFKHIRPKAHLFGHVHNHNGIYWEDGVLFSNASMMCVSRPIVIDYHKAPSKKTKLNKLFHQLHMSKTFKKN